MNLSEAYKILELNHGVSEEELNKQFKKLAAKYHPDINKNPGSLEMSKKISEAYNLIKNAPKNVSSEVRTWTAAGDVHFNINEIFETFIDFSNGSFRRTSSGGFGTTQTFKRQQPVESSIHLTFEEAVLGCQKQIHLEKYVKCATCYGKGFDLSKSCPDCKDPKKIKTRDASGQCVSCHGLGKQKIDCKDCNNSGSKKTDTILDIKLPGGIVTGTRLKLGGQGNYNRFAGSDYYDDAHILVTVTPEPDMSLNGMDVISIIEVSLLDALKGITKTIRTVKGAVSIQIPALSKNKDKINIAGAGVGGRGNHVAVLDIKYPEDTRTLIDFLSKEG